MKIRTLFQIVLLAFVLMLVFVVVSKQLPPMGLFVPLALVLAFLVTQWYIPMLCGKLAHFCIKRNRPALAEKIARFGVAVGKPLDGVYFRRTNLARHLTPTMSCSNFLHLALLQQGKYSEMQKFELERLQILKDESGDGEGRGATKSKLASTTHKTGDTVKALRLANEALNELSEFELKSVPNKTESDNLRKQKGRVFAAEKASALFTRATILESILHFEAALPDREQALAVAQETFGASSKQMTPHMVMLGKLFMKLGLYDRAEPLLTKGLELRLLQLEPDDKLIASAQLSLSMYYCETGDLEKAESLLLPAVESAAKGNAQSPGPAMAEFHQALAFLRQRQGRNDEAAKSFNSAREHFRKYFPANHSIMYELNSRMLELLRITGRDNEAMELEAENAAMETMFKEAEKYVRRP